MIEYSFLKEIAKKFSATAIGCCEVASLSEERKVLEEWINDGYNAGMSFFKKNLEARTNPQLYWEPTRSIIACLFYYYNPKYKLQKGWKVSRFAATNDYHFVVSDQLKNICAELKKKYPEFEGKICVDTAPVMEKAWAQRCGLGWIGKNGLLISEEYGSYCFIGIILSNLPIDHYDKPSINGCRSCSLCTEACPNQAIVGSGIVDCRRCISYLTIEHKGEIIDWSLFYDNWIFGCDICQDVCPWNNPEHKKESSTKIPDFLKIMIPEIWSEVDWLQLDKKKFDKLFSQTPIKRKKLDDLKQLMWYYFTVYRDIIEGKKSNNKNS